MHSRAVLATSVIQGDLLEELPVEPPSQNKTIQSIEQKQGDNIGSKDIRFSFDSVKDFGISNSLLTQKATRSIISSIFCFSCMLP